ncbi:MAG: alpha/beta hydrolase, partial [Rhodoferax sp.]|nr:alpha/beta hydrolase [Rhodoferax sp.]
MILLWCRRARLGSLLALLAVWPAWAQTALKPCRVPGIATAVQCGVVQRALDPARAEGVSIDVHFVVVPALARRKLPDPVFLLAGGPGQSAIDVAPMVVKQMARLNNRRDLVFVDQRGTGRSAPLMCEQDRHASLAQQLDAERQDARLRQCLTALQKLPHGDLRFYTTTLAMQDVDAVRRAIGAQ